MFREMRRKDKLLSEEEALKILERCTSGVLAVDGDEGYPYAVPLNYAMKDGKLFFHFAKEGHKIDAIGRNEKVTFCVVDQEEIVAEKFTTHFRSVIVFGRARLLTDDAEKRSAMEALVEKLSPDYTEEGKKAIEGSWHRVSLAEIKIEHMTGKASPVAMQ
ncbi:MAG TPA: pyridoxamine 5'-phosphate oxidase family protein [Anaerovoracaceae bacterium]|nr:pyridoxamine 5'-phosphate oxidase family protein [Anaerovoracaceae bacterium]